MVIEILIMKVLIYSGMFLSLTTAVYAGDMLGDNRLLKILAGLEKANQPSNESFNDENPLGHAEVQPSVEGASSVLVGGDSGSVSEENILGDANTASPVLGELSKQESLEDQKFGALSGTGPNEDESLLKSPLDSKMGKVKPEAKVLDKANPNSAAAAA